MTAEKTAETNGQSPNQTQPKSRARKAVSRKGAAKRKTAAASRRGVSSSASPRSSKNASKSASARTRCTSKKSAASSGYAGAATRLLSRGKRAAGNAYEWAAEGAGRALPLAARRMPDQRMVQKLADERPYMLGALGLGIGAMIGLMLPSPIGRMSSPASQSTGRSRSRR